jgi:hypothetical protein
MLDARVDLRVLVDVVGLLLSIASHGHGPSSWRRFGDFVSFVVEKTEYILARFRTWGRSGRASTTSCLRGRYVSTHGGPVDCLLGCQDQSIRTRNDFGI